MASGPLLTWGSMGAGCSASPADSQVGANVPYSAFVMVDRRKELMPVLDCGVTKFGMYLNMEIILFEHLTMLWSAVFMS